MKKKFFMRGFGVGVLVTSLVVAGFSMIRSDSTNVSPTDQPQSGSIVSESPLDKETEAPISEEPSAMPVETAPVSETPSPTPAPGADGSAAPSTAPAATQAATDVSQNDKGTEDNAVPANGDAASGEQQKVLVEIPRGADSYTVAKKVKEQGLISDAGEFDEYLINRGYAERITAGTYEIAKGSTYEQIAKKISGISK